VSGKSEAKGGVVPFEDHYRLSLSIFVIFERNRLNPTDFQVFFEGINIPDTLLNVKYQK
jgi:hypothetical protein